MLDNNLCLLLDNNLCLLLDNTLLSSVGQCLMLGKTSLRGHTYLIWYIG
jgi:hypothetical protein